MTTLHRLLSVAILVLATGCSTVPPGLSAVQHEQASQVQPTTPSKEFSGADCSARVVTSVAVGVMAVVFVPLMGVDGFFDSLRKSEKKRPTPTCFK